MPILQERGINCWTFEEGYIRPNYVTCELNGNNRNSPLSRCGSESFHGQLPEAVPLRHLTRAMALRAASYYIALSLGKPFFKDYIHHRNRGLVDEFVNWNVSFARFVFHRFRDHKLAKSYLEGATPFFLVALQVLDDLQLRSHGRFWSVETMIDFVLNNFARFSPPKSRLLFKVHPLARGHFNHLRQIIFMAKFLNIEHRVDVVLSGPAMPLIAKALGVITINSTVGIGALRADIPVAVLGHAFYDHDRNAYKIRNNIDLSNFWSVVPIPASANEKKRFSPLNASLLAGSFYLPKTWPALCKRIVEKIELREMSVNCDVPKQVTIR